MKRYAKNVLKIISALEVMLAIVIIAAVLIHGFGLFLETYAEIKDGHFIFIEEFISDVLLLVIGLELAIVLIRHTPESVLQVMIFAVARKTLIYTEEPYELIIGVVALGGLFAIKKYLCDSKEKSEDTF